MTQLKLLGGFICLLLISVVAQASTLNVITSYPQPVVAVIQQAFEKSHPDISLNILWRRPHDALMTLTNQPDEAVDVIWLPSPRVFYTLKDDNQLTPLNIDETGLPNEIGNASISDADGYFMATEIAGYGLFFEPETLSKNSLAVPTTWQDLQHPQWQSHVALPIPSEVNFAHMLIDQLLQTEGWQIGWQQWQQIAANSQLMGRGTMFTTEAVSTGVAKIAFTMDFFAATSIANGVEGRFIYPEKTAFNPAHVAILSRTKQTEAANTFAAFLVSESGQKALLHPDVRKLPIRPSVYQATSTMQNPFSSDHHANYDYPLGFSRREFNAVVFDASITAHHDKLKNAWQQWYALQAIASSEELAEIKKMLLNWPVSEPKLDDEIVLACAQRHDDDVKRQNCEAYQAEISQIFEQQYDQALAKLAKLSQKQ
ncbi:ABC transporter substrate-binding protein [Methylophaga sp. OBS3]|uniref:ABC transporter substrate-binding protein n=1 Tax=Methylophaga sp. OBS3 TaxID=2991934 RepID=UPI00225B340B|nr:extracellular solute-binding protein [Methylophaga sp. OBS3]MCX4190580.1 extracellular solute-binding protein [Methylophaga sp. OBS3]